MPYKDADVRRAKQKAYASRPEVKARAKERMATYVKGDRYREYDRARSKSPERIAWREAYMAKPERIQASREADKRRESTPLRMEWKREYAAQGFTYEVWKRFMAKYSQTDDGRSYQSAKAARYVARTLAATGSHSVKEWAELRAAFGGRCAYCGQTKRLERDHAVPPIRGGSNAIGNIQPACRSCNARKGTRTAAEFMGAMSHG